MTEIEKTINLIKLLDNAQEDGDCYIWHGTINSYGQPLARLIWSDDKRQISVRRLVYLLCKGWLPEGKPLTNKCGNRLCIAADHIYPSTNKAIARKAAAAGAFSRPARHLKIAKTKADQSDLSWDAVRDIRASSEPLKVVAARHGISFGYASAIRLHKTRKELGMFTGLMAANDGGRKRA